MNIGHAILEEIVKQGMVRIAHPEINEPVVFVWNANAAEQIEAVVDGVCGSELARLHEAIARQNMDIEQTAGQALGYPWYKEDQKNFPGSTEKDGVCVGEHVAESIVAELAAKYKQALKRIADLEAAIQSIAKCEGATSIDPCGDERFGLHCGLEDRLITSRYDAADYGYAQGVERALEWASNEAKHAIGANEVKP